MDRKLLGMVLMVILAAVVVGGYFAAKKFQKPEITPLEKQESGLGGELYEDAQNPAEKLPETNPFETQINPLQQTNPFEKIYENPFNR